MLEKNAKIFVAGHHGLVGSAIRNNLLHRGYTNLTGRSHKELDLLDGVAVKKFFDEVRPILQIQQNVIGESFRHGVKKQLFLEGHLHLPARSPATYEGGSFTDFAAGVYQRARRYVA